MPDYQNFRQRLDAVLRTLDVKKVSEFLISEGQWDEGSPADPAFAMWMMIGAALTLKELHPQAKAWLLANGHEEEAQAIFAKGPRGSAPVRKGSQRAQGPKSGNRGGNAPPYGNASKNTPRRSGPAGTNPNH